MTLSICIIGIDGSGKSTITTTLADLAIAALSVTVGTVGDRFACKRPTEDLTRPGFTPDGTPLAARLGRLLRRGAKAATGSRRLYPPLKLGQLALQERTARWLVNRYQPDLLVCDGSLLLSAAGRAINYADPISPSEATTTLEPAQLIEALYAYVAEDQPLPATVGRSWRGLTAMRRLYQLDQRFGLGLLQLPDVLIFLDIAPAAALERLQARGDRLDPHENLSDMAQARAMYQGVVEFFRRRRGEAAALVLDVSARSVAETIPPILDFLQPLLPVRPVAQRPRERLGSGGTALTRRADILKKALAPRYLLRYLLPNLHRGSLQELTFPLSQPGRQLLRAGYSAEVMQDIYLPGARRGLFARAFQNYLLHRAVYDRLQILDRQVEQEFHRHLEAPDAGNIKVCTAPSGYALDLRRPLARLAAAYPQRRLPLHVLAADLDPDGRIEAEVTQACRAANLHLDFVRGDLTTGTLRERLVQGGPYAMVLFVGLSSWIARPDLLRHLQLIHERLLASGGLLLTDCFTPHAYALSGKYMGYQANYYTPQEFTRILAYCGFDLAAMTWESGRDGINHVVAARVPPRQLQLERVPRAHAVERVVHLPG